MGLYTLACCFVSFAPIVLYMDTLPRLICPRAHSIQLAARLFLTAAILDALSTIAGLRLFPDELEEQSAVWAPLLAYGWPVELVMLLRVLAGLCVVWWIRRVALQGYIAISPPDALWRHIPLIRSGDRVRRNRQRYAHGLLWAGAIITILVAGMNLGATTYLLNHL